MNEGLRGIKTYSDRVLCGGSSKVSHSNKSKLIALYHTALKQCEGEAEAIRKVLDEIQKLRRVEFEMILDGKMSRGQMISVLNDQARTLPLWVGQVEGHPPAGVGAVPWGERDELRLNSIVAAFVDDVWILATVMVSGAAGRRTRASGAERARQVRHQGHRRRGQPPDRGAPAAPRAPAQLQG